VSFPVLDALTDEELRFEIARRDLAIRLLGTDISRMEPIEQERLALEAEDHRRHSIFNGRGFKGGV